MPDATPTSTGTPSRARRNRLWTAAKVLLAAVIIWYIGRALIDQWTAFRNVPLAVEPRWGWIVLAAVIYFAGFLVLIETWRRMIVAWGARLTFGDATTIFFISAVVRYLPGSTLVSLGAMAKLSERRNVPPATATGASVINTAVNLATGFGVALIAGVSVLETVTRGHATLGLAMAVIVFIGLLTLPALLPRILALVKRATGREVSVGNLPMRAIYISLVGNLIGWTLYGVSYRALIVGVLGEARGATASYIAVYAAAYVAGYLVFFLPAGAGIREGVQTTTLPILGFANPKQAMVVAIAARLLSMLLEIVPGLFFLSRGTRSQEPTDRHGSTH